MVLLKSTPVGSWVGCAVLWTHLTLLSLSCLALEPPVPAYSLCHTGKSMACEVTSVCHFFHDTFMQCPCAARSEVFFCWGLLCLTHCSAKTRLRKCRGPENEHTASNGKTAGLQWLGLCVSAGGLAGQLWLFSFESLKSHLHPLECFCAVTFSSFSFWDTGLLK